MNNRTRNIVIATALSAVSLIGGLKYKQHQDNIAFADSCQDARQVRLDAAKFMATTLMSGHGGYAAQATVLMQDASDIIDSCNAKGF